MSDQEAVIFDLDGVLVDSSQAHFESWQLLCRERGWAISRAQFDTTFGRTSREIIREFWGHVVRCDAEVAEVDDRKESLFRELLAREFPAIDGGVELIDHLRAAGFVVAIVTPGRRRSRPANGPWVAPRRTARRLGRPGTSATSGWR